MAKNFTALRIDEETLLKVDKIAEKSKRTRSNMIRFIIEKYFDSYEI